MEGAGSRDELRSELPSEPPAAAAVVALQEQPSGAGEGQGESQQGEGEGEGEGEGDGEDESEVLIGKAQGLMDKITANPENPSPSTLHALSSILETQEARYAFGFLCLYT